MKYAVIELNGYDGYEVHYFLNPREAEEVFYSTENASTQDGYMLVKILDSRREKK